MADKALLGSLGVHNLSGGVGRLDNAGVANLAAHFRIKRRGVKDDLALVALGKRGNALAVLDNCDDAGVGLKLVVAHEVRGAFLLQQLGMNAAERGPCGLGVVLGCSTGAVTLSGHAHVKAVLIHADAAFSADLLGKLDGETIGVMQGECLLARKDVACGKVAQCALKVGLAGAQRLAEALFLGKDDALDKLAVCN